ncbi:MAG: hypothetical protein AAGC60_18155 [Acidobacteriota bacterium]
MTLVQLIRTTLQNSGLSTAEFEALLLYDIDMLRLMGNVGEQASNREVLRRVAPQLGAGICGEVANQLAEVLLGSSLGIQLKRLLNDMSPVEPGDLQTGKLGGQSACWGRGAASVQASGIGFFVLADAFYLINLGTAHRFVAIKQGGEVEILQAWYDAAADLGYTVSDWLALNNTRISRTFSQFTDDLAKTTTGSRDAGKALFQPVGGPFLAEDRFNLGQHELTFAAVAMTRKQMASNFLEYYVGKLRALD